MRLSISVDSIDTDDFRSFLAHMAVYLPEGVPVTARCNGPEKWAGESAMIPFEHVNDAADFLRALASRITKVRDSDPELEALLEEAE